jgi:hypothetical protein
MGGPANSWPGRASDRKSHLPRRPLESGPDVALDVLGDAVTRGIPGNAHVTCIYECHNTGLELDVFIDPLVASQPRRSKQRLGHPSDLWLRGDPTAGQTSRGHRAFPSSPHVTTPSRLLPALPATCPSRREQCRNIFQQLFLSRGHPVRPHRNRFRHKRPRMNCQ